VSATLAAERSTSTARRRMGDRVAKQDRPKPGTVPLRVEPDIAEMAQRAAKLLGEDTPAFVSRLLRPVLKREYRRALEQEQKQFGENDD